MIGEDGIEFLNTTLQELEQLKIKDFLLDYDS
jgi:hypothetical protein